jgi:hypothetical protein
VQKFDVEIFNEVKISNRFAALENLMIMWTSVGLGKVLDRM